MFPSSPGKHWAIRLASAAGADAARSTVVALEELRGRTSGDAKWDKARRKMVVVSIYRHGVGSMIKAMPAFPPQHESFRGGARLQPGAGGAWRRRVAEWYSTDAGTCRLAGANSLGGSTRHNSRQ
mgnify:CR=1 FL=1